MRCFMPSAFDAHIGINRDTAEKLLRIEPELESNFGAFVKRIILDFADGKLVYKDRIVPSDLKLKDKKDMAQLNLIFLKIWRELQAMKLEGVQISPTQLVEILNGNFQVPCDFKSLTPTLPNKHESQLALSKEEQSQYDEHADKKNPDGSVTACLQCTECGTMSGFEFTKGNFDSFHTAQRQYIEHMQSKHNRNCNATEIRVFERLAIL